MRFMMVMAAAVTGLLSTTLAAEDLARKYGVRLHPTIYVCADDATLASDLRAKLPPGYRTIDGQTQGIPADVSEVTLAVFGRHEGAAAICALKHPKVATLLELAKVDIEISRREFVERLSKMGAKVVGPVESGQIIEWDNRDGGTFVDWFIDICILEAPKCDTTDGPSTLLEMSLVK